MNQADQIQKNVAKIGFDFPDVTGAYGKLEEELAELQEAIVGQNSDEIEEEFGDCLFSLVNVGRKLGLSSEQALLGTIHKFRTRALTLDRRVVVHVGDLTFLHDVGGLLAGPLERRPRLTVVVANDDGGSIFATLEHGEPERADVFERVFGTPHGADLASLAAGFGARHVRATVAEVGDVLARTRDDDGVLVVEVRIDRTGRRALHAAIGAAVRDAVDGALGG